MDLTLNEIKKDLYKFKPVANRFTSANQFTLYDCVIDYPVRKSIQIFFKVPDSEAINFSDREPAQLLIRWYDGYKTI